MDRASAVHDFLSALHHGLFERSLGAPATAAVDRIYAALDTPARPGSAKVQHLRVCDNCLTEALATARDHSASMGRIADSFAAIEPSLFWAPRSASGPHASENWAHGHANAMIVGPGGPESRNDLHVGVSLLAPHVRYPDHHHGPEEVYLVLSPGRFQHGESGWFEPGIGGTLYNQPDIRHAMASDAAPLFAIWLLWTGKAAADV